MVLGYATSKGKTFFDPERNVALHPNISAHSSACTLGREPSSSLTPTCQRSSMHMHSRHTRAPVSLQGHSHTYANTHSECAQSAHVTCAGAQA